MWHGGEDYVLSASQSAGQRAFFLFSGGNIIQFSNAVSMDEYSRRHLCEPYSLGESSCFARVYSSIRGFFFSIFLCVCVCIYTRTCIYICLCPSYK